MHWGGISQEHKLWLLCRGMPTGDTLPLPPIQAKPLPEGAACSNLERSARGHQGQPYSCRRSLHPVKLQPWVAGNPKPVSRTCETALGAKERQAYTSTPEIVSVPAIRPLSVSGSGEDAPISASDGQIVAATPSQPLPPVITPTLSQCPRCGAALGLVLLPAAMPSSATCAAAIIPVASDLTCATPENSTCLESVHRAQNLYECPEQSTGFRAYASAQVWAPILLNLDRSGSTVSEVAIDNLNPPYCQKEDHSLVEDITLGWLQVHVQKLSHWHAGTDTWMQPNTPHPYLDSQWIYASLLGMPDENVKKPDSWTDMQNKLVEGSVRSTFREHVLAVNPTCAGWDNVKCWASSCIKELLNKDEFSEIIDEKERKTRSVQMMNKLKNYYNNNLRKKAHAQGAVDTKPDTPRQLDDRFLNLFVPHHTGRAAFERQEKESLTAAANGNVGTYQSLLKAKWDALSPGQQASWQQSVNAECNNFYRNINHFNESMPVALSTIAQSGLLGDALLFFTFATKTPDAGLKSRFYSATFGPNAALISEDQESAAAYEAFKEQWALYSMRNIPNPPLAKPRPNDAYINIEELNTSTLRCVMTDYLDALWDYFRKGEPLDDGTWEKIGEDPSSFYDMATFLITLQNPVTAQSSLLHMMATTLQSFSESNKPFALYRNKDCSHDSDNAMHAAQTRSHEASDHSPSADLVDPEGTAEEVGRAVPGTMSPIGGATERSFGSIGPAFAGITCLIRVMAATVRKKRKKNDGQVKQPDGTDNTRAKRLRTAPEVHPRTILLRNGGQANSQSIALKTM
ncbi:hypothetical protein K488DRAFT_74096 [Vararia minispora EC-137]|uniref:Uncharacterized protein n=1 Tax=Vararia minispora EC-137 TaxID=1314806 RepID=A0ACB8Q889_9AGAM|nr:hypothetical protein K488DRAFT_74096 [Vararia minispora EC-137]